MEELKVGDRVRLLNDGGYGGNYRAGLRGSVSRVHGRGLVAVHTDEPHAEGTNDLSFFVGSEVEKIDTPAPARPAPKSRQRRFNEAQNIAKRAVRDLFRQRFRTDEITIRDVTVSLAGGGDFVEETRAAYRAAYRAVRLMQQREAA